MKRIPSRFMPDRIKPKEIGSSGFVVLFIIILFPAFIMLSSGKGMSGVIFIYGFLGVFYLVAHIRGRRHFDMLNQGREGDSLCTFARHFERYEVDTWIIRAVYEELAAYCPEVPIRPTDNIFDDLCIDEDDFVMDFNGDIVGDIAKRCGRSLKDFETNPYYEKADTVEGLVHFFNNQPKS